MNPVQQFSFGVEFNYTGGDWIAFILVGAAQLVLPPLVIFTGLYWVLRGNGNAKRPSPKPRLIGSAMIFGGILSLVLASYYNSEVAIYLLGPVACVTGYVHMKLQKTFTGVSMILIGLGVVAPLILGFYALARML